MQAKPATLEHHIREAAAQFIVPRFKTLSKNDIQEKTGADDLVTLADTEAEAYLEASLQKAFPKYDFLGEEKVSRDKSVLSLLQQTNKPFFIVDPVDGTNNFVRGSSDFGLMLSVVEGGQVTQAYIYDILNDHFVSAVKGEGAYDGSKPLKMSSTPKTQIGFSKSKYHSQRVITQFNLAAAKEGLQWHILNCSAHEYMRTLRGEERFYFACNVMPWDHLAGSLIIREAGGVCAKWDGTDYGVPDLGASILSAATEEDWDYLHRNFLQPEYKHCRPKFK